MSGGAHETNPACPAPDNLGAQVLVSYGGKSSEADVCMVQGGDGGAYRSRQA